MRENYQLMPWSNPYSCCQLGNQLQGREAQQHAAIGPRLGQMIHEVVVGNLLEPLLGAALAGA